jgi:hypothetical protein
MILPTARAQVFLLPNVIPLRSSMLMDFMTLKWAA